MREEGHEQEAQTYFTRPSACPVSLQLRGIQYHYIDIIISKKKQIDEQIFLSFEDYYNRGYA